VSDGADQLPDDPVLLKQMIAQRDAAIVQIKREASERIEAMEQRHRAEMDAILRRFYGPRSEKFDPTELLLFGLNVAEQVPVDPAVVAAESGEKLTTRRINHHKHGRRTLPGHLPRIEVVHDLTDEQKACPCCGELRTRIGSETSEQLEYVPASLKVFRHVRHKYACRACDAGGNGGHVEIATKTPQPIEKGLPGPGLLAYVIVSKLGDHLPLYRLEKIFDRHGVDLARSTMCAWMLAASELVKPLIELMINRVKQGKVIHTDETRVPVQAEGQCRSGRIWTYIGDEGNPYVVYDYTPDRARSGPQRFLSDYNGYLQADAYRVRRHLHQGQRDRGRLLGPRPAQVLRRPGDRRPAGRRDAGVRPPALRVGGRGQGARPRRPARPAAGEERAGPGADQGLAGCGGATRAPAQPNGGGHHVRAQPVGRAVPLRRAGVPQYRQQRRRAGAEAGGDRQEELAVRRS
jgi:transposase